VKRYPCEETTVELPFKRFGHDDYFIRLWIANDNQREAVSKIVDEVHRLLEKDWIEAGSCEALAVFLSTYMSCVNAVQVTQEVRGVKVGVMLYTVPFEESKCDKA
jgi:hypothetical protein